MNRMRLILLRWHHRIGAISAIFIIWVTLTGLIIQFLGLLNITRWHIEVSGSPVQLTAVSAHLDNTLLVGTKDSLLWVTSAYEVIDHIPLASLEIARINQFGYSNDRVIVESSNGQRIGFNQHLTEWQVVDTEYQPLPNIQHTTQLSALSTALAEHHDVDILRVLGNLHTGRTLGVTGEFLNMLAALALLFLATSGLYYFLTRNRRHTPHPMSSRTP